MAPRATRGLSANRPGVKQESTISADLLRPGGTLVRPEVDDER
jgi:hypothetical protein